MCSTVAQPAAGYDAEIAPESHDGNRNGPLTIAFTRFLFLITEINDRASTLSVQLGLFSRWRDNRLQFNNLQGWRFMSCSRGVKSCVNFLS